MGQAGRETHTHGGADNTKMLSQFEASKMGGRVVATPPHHGCELWVYRRRLQTSRFQTPGFKTRSPVSTLSSNQLPGSTPRAPPHHMPMQGACRMACTLRRCAVRYSGWGRHACSKALQCGARQGHARVCAPVSHPHKGPLGLQGLMGRSSSSPATVHGVSRSQTGVACVGYVPTAVEVHHTEGLSLYIRKMVEKGEESTGVLPQVATGPD